MKRIEIIILYIYILGQLLVSAPISWCMDSVLQDQEYQTLKAALYNDVDNNNYLDITQNIEKISNIIHQKTVRYSINLKDQDIKKSTEIALNNVSKPAIKDLLHEPPNRSIFELALKKHDLGLLFPLLEVEYAFDYELSNYLKSKLIIDPTHDEYFKQQNEKLLQAIKNGDFEETKKLLHSFDQYLKQKFIPSPVNATPEMEEYFTKNILPIYFNIIREQSLQTALYEKNISMLYLLFKELELEKISPKYGLKSYGDFMYYLKKYFIINPDTDTYYVQQRTKLHEAISNSNQFHNIYESRFDINYLASRFNVDNLLSTFKDKLMKKLIPSALYTSPEIEKYFNSTVWPQYLDNLISSIQDVALKKQHFGLIYYLLNEKSEDEAENEIIYFDLLKTHPIVPNQDDDYLQFKDELMRAITKGNRKRIKDIFTDFSMTLEDKYIGKTYNVKIAQHLITSIKPLYYEQLLSDVLPQAIKEKNVEAIYILLNYINQENTTIFESFAAHFPNIIHDLLAIKDQAIYDELNGLIAQTIVDITRMNFENSKKLILTFLNYFSSIESPRLATILIKSYASHYTEYSFKELIKAIPLSYFSENSDIIIKNYLSYNKFFKLHTSLLKKNYVEAEKLFNPRFSNEKDLNGNSILIILVEQAKTQDDLDQIEKLIKTGLIDINLPGQASITPLMHAITIKPDDLSIQTKLINFLLQHGANYQARDIYEKTALDYARETNNTAIIELLENYIQQLSKPSLSMQEQIIALSDLKTTLNSFASYTR